LIAPAHRWSCHLKGVVVGATWIEQVERTSAVIGALPLMLALSAACGGVMAWL